ncbi:ATP-binding cassette domain-containing protein [Ichthyenterobacterium sp. W332]|uniref:ATP-binding cassette domain-containing protein n=1 Tax=Microcosmobacter mediterraneus TaxID=3075607 RepID=A0ABU2YHK4_9FLAO|nr:ATP-binding cassette domain-containing protein [Ichthyenterobacterium sp. W332]MDT0557265.1 ATP-binding cassette domain-containing protein [Ichthyenterobacterium sp. W332]
MSTLHVDSIMKRYGNNQVLSDVFMSCSTGGIIGLLGRNGSGKSTLLKIIFGALHTDNKFVKVDDDIINATKDTVGRIAYLPQDNFLPNHIKIKTLIVLLCETESIQFIKDHQLISPFLNRYVKALSGGERRILEVFLIIFSRAKFILIDEPFNGIAPIYKDEIKDLIRRQTKHKGFIITDHDYSNVLDLASKVVLLHNGSTRPIKNIKELEQFGYLP